MRLNRLELAWAAGFFDGKGCFSINRLGKSPNPKRIVGGRVGIVQKEKHNLVRFRKAVLGLGHITGPYFRRSPKGKRVYRFDFVATTFEEVQAIIGLLWFKLGPAKRRKARLVLRAARKCRRNRPCVS